MAFAGVWGKGGGENKRRMKREEENGGRGECLEREEEEYGE